MNDNGSKLTCSACHAYLFDDDDVVYCPVCGAPHHRECYNEIGHCALEDKHGTPEQYDSSKNAAAIRPDASNSDGVKRIKCAMCGNEYNAADSSCGNCGAPNPARAGGAAFQFDFLGGVPADMDLGDGVTADEMKEFVILNTQRYIPKFAANKLGKKASFNWLAFLFPCGWFLSRKMYKIGAVIGAVTIALTMLVFPLQSALASFISDSTDVYSQALTVLSENLGRIGVPAIISAAAGSVLNIVLRILCGIFGDFIYRNHCIAAVKDIKENSSDIEEDMRRRGGVNIFMFAVGLAAVSYIPGIIAALAGI